MSGLYVQLAQNCAYNTSYTCGVVFCPIDVVTPNKPYHFGYNITNKLANYGENVGKTTPVGKYPPNAFGLYDMHGNVWELCQDDWHKNYKDAPTDGKAWLSVISDEMSDEKILRGGSWYILPGSCRSATRGHHRRVFYDFTFGFRVVCGF